MVRKLRGIFFKMWYWYISAIDKNAEVVFMNFGFSDKSKIFHLNESDEKNRYSIQLYHAAASQVDLKGKRILEVGCGRGGGLSFVCRYLSPEKAVGLDLSDKAIEFCQNHYKEENIEFIQGNAQELPFENNSFDAVLNVESSHRYPNAEQFFTEVNRILKPNGHFLFTDFRNIDKVDELEMQLTRSAFKIESKQDITANVVDALALSTQERERLIKKLAPRVLHGLCRNFAAKEGSPVYNKFSSRKLLYLNYLLTKQARN